MNIKTCPFCGKKTLNKINKNLTRTIDGKRITIPDVEVLECSNCKEKMFDSHAMSTIEAYVHSLSPKSKKIQI
ncbi:MAG: hypothetical protein A2583_02150 [Bdellovibrionales bacterium RIFOXYD1_FULL_53_11]|nr:MAG: hypothetical protein A2583_02150 [Bdellovibrionales bacterium RIFOXYD1_FULL_53_11]